MGACRGLFAVSSGGFRATRLCLMLDFFHLFISPPVSSLLYTGHYDSVLVSLSVAVAILASYAALLVSQHVASTTVVSTRRMWIAVGGLCLGLGIWAMHFGVLACTLALTIISRRTISGPQLATGGLLLGSGIGAMHYAGMAALRLEGLLRYDLKLCVLSIFVAVVLATLAIWIKFRLQFWPFRWSNWVPILSATAMGLAVSGMHYTARAAAYFIREGDTTVVDSQLGATFLASIVLAATGVIIVVTLVATYVARPNLMSLGNSYKVIGLLIIGWSVASWLTADYYHDRQTSNLYQQELQLAGDQAEDVATHIDDSLQLLKAVAFMLSRDADVHGILRRVGAQAAPSTVPYETRKQQWTQNKELAGLHHSLNVAATQLKADVISVLNAAGDTVAASNFDQPDSLVGSNFGEREYFQQARAGHPSQQYAVGWTTKLPGLYYSHPVIDNGQFMGAVIVKRNISSLSQGMKQAQAFITDTHGVIVLAPDKALEFRTLPDAAVGRLSAELRQLQYGQSAFEPLRIAPWGDKRLPLAVRLGDGHQPVVLVSQSLADGMLTLHVPRPLAELARINAEMYGLFILIAAAGGMLIVAVSAVVLYLRETRKAAADLRIAATAFESHHGLSSRGRRGEDAKLAPVRSS
jgi:NO-binding membrane sensor protein with MHYT domain